VPVVEPKDGRCPSDTCGARAQRAVRVELTAGPKARIVDILDPPVRQSAGRGLSWTIYTKSPEGFSGLLVADDQQNEESNRKKAPGVPGL
jgi:hypothetical protein